MDIGKKIMRYGTKGACAGLGMLVGFGTSVLMGPLVLTTAGGYAGWKLGDELYEVMEDKINNMNPDATS